jgi:hypothetical protein
VRKEKMMRRKSNYQLRVRTKKMLSCLMCWELWFKRESKSRTYWRRKLTQWSSNN